MMTAEMPVSTMELWTRWDVENVRDYRVERQARALVAQHHCFRGRALGFEFVQSDDVLTVRGSVPSFYLKQMLQTMLMELRGVGRVDNQVDVVSSHGLSSVR
jgi:hypothetical protein